MIPARDHTGNMMLMKPTRLGQMMTLLNQIRVKTGSFALILNMIYSSCPLI